MKRSFKSITYWFNIGSRAVGSDTAKSEMSDISLQVSSFQAALATQISLKFKHVKKTNRQ